ncbi:MAG: hypothetical protein INQ03_00520 [Candidatus Heimdallarchaeota archaeon]|nr:hypothetical protein [Candidatus Heimdallarchaeota archaeon]
MKYLVISIILIQIMFVSACDPLPLEGVHYGEIELSQTDGIIIAELKNYGIGSKEVLLDTNSMSITENSANLEGRVISASTDISPTELLNDGSNYTWIIKEAGNIIHNQTFHIDWEDDYFDQTPKTFYNEALQSGYIILANLTHESRNVLAYRFDLDEKQLHSVVITEWTYEIMSNFDNFADEQVLSFITADSCGFDNYYLYNTTHITWITQILAYDHEVVFDSKSIYEINKRSLDVIIWNKQTLDMITWEIDENDFDTPLSALAFDSYIIPIALISAILIRKRK